MYNPLALGQQRKIICTDTSNNILNCSEQGTVLQIHSAIVDFEKTLVKKCFGIEDQGNCPNIPDQTKKTRNKCDGNTTCNIRDFSDVVKKCRPYWAYFDVIYSCRVDKTTNKGKQIFVITIIFKNEIDRKEPHSVYSPCISSAKVFSKDSQKKTWRKMYSHLLFFQEKYVSL